MSAYISGISHLEIGQRVFYLDRVTAQISLVQITDYHLGKMMNDEGGYFYSYTVNGLGKSIHDERTVISRANLFTEDERWRLLELYKSLIRDRELVLEYLKAERTPSQIGPINAY